MGDVLRSTLLQALGVRHGFNLRTGGVSEGAFATFNLGRATGDDAARVEENHQRFAAVVGYAPGALFEVSQVHAGHVRAVSPGEQPTLVRREEADALVAHSGGLAIGVRIADCVPVLIADASDHAVAAVHAGWRGTVAGVLEAGVHALLTAGSGDPRALRVALLPHIRRCCFEIGEDVALALGAASPDPDVIDRSGRRPHADLARILRAKLLTLGVTEDAIDDVPGCTRCEPERFFSYRRDGQLSGRHLAAIVSGR